MERLTSTTGMIRLTKRFLNFIPEGKHDQIEEEFALYQTTKDLPSDFLMNTHRVDIFCGKIGKIESSTGKPFGLLQTLLNVYFVFLIGMQIQK